MWDIMEYGARNIPNGAPVHQIDWFQGGSKGLVVIMTIVGWVTGKLTPGAPVVQSARSSNLESKLVG